MKPNNDDQLNRLCAFHYGMQHELVERGLVGKRADIVTDIAQKLYTNQLPNSGELENAVKKAAEYHLGKEENMTTNPPELKDVLERGLLKSAAFELGFREKLAQAGITDEDEVQAVIEFGKQVENTAG